MIKRGKIWQRCAIMVGFYGFWWLRTFFKFYVDTAILGNPKALELAVDFFGVDHVLFCTASPFGIPPVGPTAVIEQAVRDMNLTATQQQAIFTTNWQALMG